MLEGTEGAQKGQSRETVSAQIVYQLLTKKPLLWGSHDEWQDDEENKKIFHFEAENEVER